VQLSGIKALCSRVQQKLNLEDKKKARFATDVGIYWFKTKPQGNEGLQGHRDL